MKKIRTVIYLEPQQQRLLARLSEKTGAPVTELVRRAITEYISTETVKQVIVGQTRTRKG